MKVAICMSGQLRTYRQCYNNLIKNILKPLNADVFIQVWDKVGNSHKEELENIEIVNEKELKKLYNPKTLVIENQPQEASEHLFGKKVPRRLIEIEPLHYKSALSMYYQMKSCNDLALDYAKLNNFKYDVILRIRPDTMFLEQIPSKLIVNVLKNPHMVYFADYAININYQVCDKFAFGGTEGMILYSGVWNHIEDYWKDPVGNNPPFTHKVGERLLKYHVDCTTKLIAKPFYLNMFNLRNNGVKVNYRFYNKLKKIKYFVKYYL